ncbi:MAG: PAS domain S-box protein [Candidatus Zixiibacteriota bacterium]|nr:MAG: PAS domain S-box protein [candidate division Zixibacteria bacterium]
MPTKILIIEHSETEARNIERHLVILGFEVEGVFETLAKAFSDYSKDPPDLVLLDIEERLAGDHPGVTQKIKDRWDCPVVFTTFETETPFLQQPSAEENEIFLLKPVTDESELNSTIQLCLKQHELERILRECRKGFPEGRKLRLDDSYLTRRIEALIAELARIYGQLQRDRLHRVRSVEPLLYSEILFKTIFHHTPVGIVLVGPKGEFLMANTQFCHFLGYEKDELLQMSTSDIIHPADLFDAESSETTASIDATTVSHTEKRFLRKDGRFVLGLVGVTRIPDDSGKTVFHLWQVEDVTDQKRVEHERLKLESIVEHSPDLIGMITMSGHFRYLNPTGLNLVGATQAANQIAVSDITDPAADGDTLVELCEKVREHGLWRCELTLRGMNDGRSIPVAAHGFILNSPTPTSQPIIAVIARDLTEAKKREREHRRLHDQLIRGEKMHSLGLLAGGVAHDLNNILGPLVAYPDLILRKLPAEDPLRQQVERMRDSACSAANVVQDLLTLARRGRHEQLPVNLNQIIESFFVSPLLEKLKVEFPDITVNVRLSETQPVVLGSNAQLEKIIMNLVVNAFDAINGSGTVTVTTGVRDLSELSTGYTDLADGPYAFVSVKDTGVGIAAEDVKKIFEPYYSTKKLKGRSGTGLGLAIVYGIIKDHHGYYDLISEPGRGTEFIVYLPNATVQSVPAGAAENLCGSERLLVVDDDEQQRDVARECLESFGYTVVTAASGRKAVEILRKEDFDLILLDMIMEDDFDGLDTYRAMKELKGDVRAIIVSGSAATERVKGAQRLGAGRYVQKPYTAEKLAEAVRDEIDRARQSSTASTPSR